MSFYTGIYSSGLYTGTYSSKYGGKALRQKNSLSTSANTVENAVATKRKSKTKTKKNKSNQ